MHLCRSHPFWRGSAVAEASPGSADFSESKLHSTCPTLPAACLDPVCFGGRDGLHSQVHPGSNFSAGNDPEPRPTCWPTSQSHVRLQSHNLHFSSSTKATSCVAHLHVASGRIPVKVERKLVPISLPRYLSSSVSFGRGTLHGKGRLKRKFLWVPWCSIGCVQLGNAQQTWVSRRPVPSAEGLGVACTLPLAPG